MTASNPASRGTDTIASVLERHAHGAAGSRPFLVFEAEPGRVIESTYADAVLRARRAAGALAAAGIGPGDRFALHTVNCPEFYDAWLAAAYLGATVVPTNPLSTAAELGFMYGHAGVKLALAQSDLVDTVRQSGVDRVVDLHSGWSRDAAIFDGPPESIAESVLAVLYTSGTTSRPKGVMVSHAAYLHAGDVVAGHVRLRPQDRNLVVLPLFHGNAQYYSTMSALVTGASIALAPRFSASRWSEQAEVLGATVASLFAAPIRMILAQDRAPSDHAHRLRACLFAQNVSDAQITEFEQRFGVPLAQLYGMTETVAPPLMNPLYEERRADSMGRAVTSARVRVTDPDGADAAAGVPGELLVAGEPGRTMMTGYLEDPDATARAVRDGWLHTGDMARRDDDGYLYFVDRVKDMIKRAGENVACAEIERVVDEIPGVHESAAVGVPDDMRDEAIQVFVVLSEGASVDERNVLAHCRSRLAKFKVPDRVLIVPELPRTSVGKIQKHLLRGAVTGSRG